MLGAAALALAASAVPQSQTPAAVAHTVQITGLVTGVEREAALRQLAHTLTRTAVAALARPAGAIPIETVERAVEQVLPAAESWTRLFSVLDVSARAGLLLVGGGATPDATERPEIFAGQVRVAAVGANPADFMTRLGAALRSPYRAVRTAALDRAARALAADEPLGDRWSGLAALDGWTDTGTLDELAGIIARSGATSRSRADAALRLQMRAPDSSVASSVASSVGSSVGSAVSSLFQDWVTHPLSAEGIKLLRTACSDASPESRALVETLALVAVNRDGVALDAPPRIEAVAQLFVLQAGTEATVFDVEERLEVIARQARSAALGRALLAHAADHHVPPEQRIRCVRGAAWSLPLGELLESTRGLTEDEALELWDVVMGRDDPLPVDATWPWIEDDRDAVRSDAAREVGRRHATGAEPDLAVLLERLLVAPEPTQRTLAFIGLCDGPDASAHGAALRAAFDAEAEDGEALSTRQARWLARLPRETPMPSFRDAILGLVADQATRAPAIIELLGTFPADDVRVAELLDAALAEELAALVGGETLVDRLVPDGRAAALVGALDRTRGAAAVPSIEDALSRSMGPLHGGPARRNVRPQLPKTAVALLARSQEGRRALQQFLVFDEMVPRRVRYEAALQLAPTASLAPAASDRLATRIGIHIVTDFPAVDRTLRMRGITALAELAPVDDPVIDAFLGEIARGTHGDASERLAAIAALGRRGSLALLLPIVELPLVESDFGLADLEAASAAARALGDPALEGRRVPVAGVRFDLVAELLTDLLAVADERSKSWDGEELQAEAFIEIHGAILASLCAVIARRVSAPDDRSDGDVRAREAAGVAITRGPRASGAGDIAARFSGEDLGDVRFRWRSELNAIGAWPAAAAFFTAGVIDSRLLLVVGDMAARSGSGAGAGGLTPEWLLTTGLFAVEGERRTADAARDLVFARAALVRLHLAAEEWDAAALHTLRILVDVRRGRVRGTALESLFDISDPSLPTDAEARLAGLVRVFRGRAVLARTARDGHGDLGEARLWAERARRWARLDVEVARALADLESRIADAAR